MLRYKMSNMVPIPFLEATRILFIHFRCSFDLEIGEKPQLPLRWNVDPGVMGLVPLPGRLLEDLNSKIQRLNDATEGAC